MCVCVCVCVCVYLFESADLLLQLVLSRACVVLLETGARRATSFSLHLQLEELQVLQLLTQVLNQLHTHTHRQTERERELTLK